MRPLVPSKILAFPEIQQARRVAESISYLRPFWLQIARWWTIAPSSAAAAITAFSPDARFKAISPPTMAEVFVIKALSNPQPHRTM